jgi:hypothetical protein
MAGRTRATGRSRRRAHGRDGDRAGPVAVVGLHQASAASVGGVLFLLGAAASWTVGALLTSAANEPIVPLVVGQHLVGAPLLLVAALAD